MSHLLVFAEAVPTEIVDVLNRVGFPWKAVNSIVAADHATPEEGWAGALVIGTDPEHALAFCREMRRRDNPLRGILLAIKNEHLSQFEPSEDLFDDFIMAPLRKEELEARLTRLLWRETGRTRPDLIEFGSLILNLSTYQASVGGRPLDMTYMEYELLRHFAQNPGRVLTREELLRQVWGYEYYGGARTVDVHVRRLRAKLGDENASLIQTVRSVGYIFGRGRWDSA